MSSSEDDGSKVGLKGQYMRLDLSCISIQDISYHNDTLKQQQSSGRHIQRRDSPSGEVCFLFSQFSGTCLEIWIAFKYHLSESVSQLVLVYLLSIVKLPLPILRASLHQLNPLLLIRILPSSINEYFHLQAWLISISVETAYTARSFILLLWDIHLMWPKRWAHFR